MRAVNLLPKEETLAEAAGGLRVPAIVGGTCAAVVALAVGGFTYAEASKLHDRRAELDALRLQLAATPRPTPPPPWVARVESAQAQRSGALASALGQRVWWDRIVRELAAVLPEGVWLTRVDGQLPDATSAPAPTGEASTTQGGLQVEGVTDTHARVARLLARLAIVPDFTTVTLHSSSVSQQPGGAAPVQFRVDVGLRAPGATS